MRMMRSGLAGGAFLGLGAGTYRTALGVFAGGAEGPAFARMALVKTLKSVDVLNQMGDVPPNSVDVLNRVANVVNSVADRALDSRTEGHGSTAMLRRSPGGRHESHNFYLFRL